MRSNTRSAAVIDLFAGAGGLGIGAERGGGELRLSAEIDPVACETLRANVPGGAAAVLEADITELTGRECGGQLV